MTDRNPGVWTSDKELAGRLFAALDAMPFSEPGWYRVQEIAHELNERGEHGAVMPLIEAVRKAKEARFNKDEGDLFDCLDAVFRELAACDAERKRKE